MSAADTASELARREQPPAETPPQRWARQLAGHAEAFPAHVVKRDPTAGGHSYCSSSQPGGGCGRYVTN